MKAENAAALKYIFQEELYILPGEESFNRPDLTQTFVDSAPMTERVAKTVAEPVATSAPITEAATLIQPVTAPGPVIPKIEPASNPQPTTEHLVQTPAALFNYLGSNKKAFLIFTYYADQDFMHDEHLAALQNILKRKDIELEDVAILNLAKSINGKWAEIYRFFAPKKVLVLGKEAIPEGLNVPALNTLKVAPTASLLYSFSFDEMMSSTDNKRAFWEQMKNL
ncbi:hypothetical protein ACFS5N_08935 [Mucilaginibacter ximonensis]|uniref:Uncharacterized protein n=1 Tax=Mucilaginibacter ximonensis TaxID=538021 RepID=A0ABW5YBE5_9SPHI